MTDEQYSRDDAMRETLKHVRRVGMLMLDVIERLQRRAMEHDDSKFSSEEFDSFANATPKLRGLTYGSDEYKAALREIGPAVKLHQSRNRHHPEFYGDVTVHGMDLLDLIEMLADWKAAGERHADGNLIDSIQKNKIRFGYDDKFASMLQRTAENLGWIRGVK